MITVRFSNGLVLKYNAAFAQWFDTHTRLYKHDPNKFSNATFVARIPAEAIVEFERPVSIRRRHPSPLA
jgi:hypothetical protein